MGGHSKVVRDIIESSTDYHLAGYLDDVINDYYEEDGLIYDNLKDINRLKSQYYFVLAIGNNTVREKIFNKNDIPIERFPVFIHPSSIISPSAKIGYGTVVMPKAVINADSKIGIHTIINTNAIVEHDNQIGDYVHISPSAVLAGGVKVGNLSHIALNATVLPLVEIGSHCVVGAGATVIKMLNQNQQSLVRQQNTRSEKLKEERIYLSRPHMGGSEQNIFKMLLRKTGLPVGRKCYRI